MSLSSFWGNNIPAMCKYNIALIWWYYKPACRKHSAHFSSHSVLINKKIVPKMTNTLNLLSYRQRARSVYYHFIFYNFMFIFLRLSIIRKNFYFVLFNRIVITSLQICWFDTPSSKLHLLCLRLIRCPCKLFKLNQN